MNAYRSITKESALNSVKDAIEYQDKDLDVLLKTADIFKQELTSHSRDVATFAILAGQEIPKEPCIPDEKTRILRAKLIMEEALETIRGLGITVETASTRLQDLVFTCTHEPSLVEIIDGCLDLRVVTTGTIIACGVTDGPVLQEVVDINNLTKFRTDKDGHRREDGKWVKPSDHQAPRIEELIKALHS